MKGGRQIDDRIVEEVLDVMDEADQECCDIVHKKDSTCSSLSVGQVFRKVFYNYLENCVEDSPETRRIKEAMFQWTLRSVSFWPSYDLDFSSISSRIYCYLFYCSVVCTCSYFIP